MAGVAISLALLVLVTGCIVVPILALIRTRRIPELESRVAGVEAALLRLIRERASAEASPPGPEPGGAPAPEQPPGPPTAAPPLPLARLPLETVIGQKWLGWIAVILIFFAAAFFLKHAFESRWIGEFGRVTLGVLAGLAFTWAGFERHRRGWRYFSQVLTGGGIALLYLSTYAAFAYYHLIDQRSAFVFLALVVAEAHLLALGYDSRAIAVMALASGFLVPVLLASERDQYVALFSYIVALDLGVLFVVAARRWRWIGTLAFAGAHWLFWGWYQQHYRPEKRDAALVFQAAVFLLFVLADLSPLLRRMAAGLEEWIRLFVNPFVFFATCYSLLRNDYPDWMGFFALVMATAYAALGRAEIALQPSDPRTVMVTLGTALTFFTLAIPIQVEANWITIAWAVEAATLLWVGVDTSSRALRVFSTVVFGLALIRYLVRDIPWGTRSPFTPVFNRQFLTTAAVTACLAVAAYSCRRLGRPAVLAVGLLAAGVLWAGSSVETYSYFDAQAAAWRHDTETARRLRWAGQMALSVLWSFYAAALTAAGFRLQLRALRAAGLALFGLTLVKAVFVDIAELRQLYRIVALLALGVVLLMVAWAYQRILRKEQERPGAEP